MGHKALTNYLTHSVLGALLFYGHGLGLMGRLGSAALLGVALALFTLQPILSHLWLACFRFGPVEWVVHRAPLTIRPLGCRHG